MATVMIQPISIIILPEAREEWPMYIE